MTLTQGELTAIMCRKACVAFVNSVFSLFLLWSQNCSETHLIGHHAIIRFVGTFQGKSFDQGKNVTKGAKIQRVF